jgi:hypothetical protein
MGSQELVGLFAGPDITQAGQALTWKIVDANPHF